jgi:predicted RNase H-like nuclease
VGAREGNCFLRVPPGRGDLRPGAYAFIGIDLAWSPSNPSGLAALRPGRRGLEVLELATCSSDDEIADFVRGHLAATTIVMVDAPLVIPNQSGMRACDRLVHVRFGARQAGCYPANRNNMGRLNGGLPRGESLGRRLVDLGFRWPPGPLPRPPVSSGRRQFECYPHPAQVVLFHLSRSLKYKRKRQGWNEARREFGRYLGFMKALRSPAIAFTRALLREFDVSRAVGKEYKRREDRLDALFCAYLAALVPTGRLEMLGRPREGSIVVPRERRNTSGRGARRGVEGP